MSQQQVRRQQVRQQSEVHRQTAQLLTTGQRGLPDTREGTVDVTLSKPGAKPGELERLLKAPKFQQWWQSVNVNEGKDYVINQIDIRDINWFGKEPKQILGFFKADCVVYRIDPETGDVARNSDGAEATVPAIAFVRGGQ